MKKIKLLLPVWLILMYFVTISYMIQSRTERRNEYLHLVADARTYAGNDVLIDASSAYESALDIYPNMELAIEAGKVYLDHEEYTLAEKWYVNKLHTNFPDQMETYEYGIQTYLAQDNYREAFAVYDESRERELTSEKIDAMMLPVLYSFDLSGQYDEVRPFSNLSGLAAVKYNDYWGYINTDGERVLDYIYSQAGMLGDIGAVVDKDGQAYFIDKAGNKKITDRSVLQVDPELGTVKRFLGVEGGTFWAYNGAIWNCYNAQTCEKLFGGYYNATNISNGIGAVENEQSKWALISSDGNLLTDFLYDDILTDLKDVFCRTSIVFVKEGDHYITLNKKGELVGNEIYEDACAFYDTTYAAVKKDGKWSYIDQDGNVSNIGTFDQAKSFSNGLAAVCQDGKWGYIDLNGNLLIDCQFDDAGQFFASGVAFVKPEGETSWKLLSLYKDNYE